MCAQKKRDVHVGVSDAGGGKLGDGTEQEEVKARQSTGLGNTGLDLLKDGVLDDGVGDQDEGGHDTLPEGLETVILDHLLGSFQSTQGTRVGCACVAGCNAGLFCEGKESAVRRFVSSSLAQVNFWP